MNSHGECGVSAVKRGWAAAGRAGSHGTSQAFTMQAPPAESVVLLLGNGRPTSKSLVVPTCVCQELCVQLAKNVAPPPRSIQSKGKADG